MNRTEYHAEWRKKNKDKVKSSQEKYRAKNLDKLRENARVKAKEKRDTDIVGHMLLRSKERAKLKGYKFTLCREDVVIPSHCPILGIKLQRNCHRDYTPTLDRIDNSRGYEPDNICVISGRANRIKSDATLEELKAIVGYLEKTSKS